MKKIMIVEDQMIVAMNMKSELCNMDYEVCKLIATGEEAVRIAEQESPGVILMDIMLNGGMDGIEAANKIRSFCNIPIIFMTGCGDEGTRERAKNIEYAEYFNKPIDIEDLKTAIEKVLDSTGSE